MSDLLFFQWNAFMQKGMENALKRMNVEYDIFTYIFKDWDKDDIFVNIFYEKLKESSYKKILSVNFAPLISQVCEQINKETGRNIEYVSWVYDAPIHIRRIEQLKNSCNSIYFFDRIQAENYKAAGVDGAEHLTLAVDSDVFLVEASNENSDKCDVSLLGQLYKSDYEYLLGPLDGYYRGYLEGIVEAQKKLYGGYIISELIDNKLLSELNKIYDKASGGTFKVNKRELEYALATEVTGRERLLALALLQSRCKVHLYSNDMDERLTNVINKGYVDYYTQMPKVFKNSKINLNISLKIIQSGIPLRVLDVLGCGGFLITNYQPELIEWFEPGVDLVIYEDIPDLIKKVEYYLSHEDERQQIAENGCKKVKKLFSYDERLKKMLKID